MAATYEPIATTTLGSAAANITFNSISSSYTDLQLVLAFGVVSNSYTAIQFNSDTGTNYSTTFIYGTGTSATSDRLTSDNNLYFSTYNSQASGNVLFGKINIFSYSGSTYKTSLLEYSGDKNGSGEVARAVGLWRSTSAITSLKIFQTNGTNIASGTTATLYGIKAA